jgi:hypothetical protein
MAFYKCKSPYFINDAKLQAAANHDSAHIMVGYNDYGEHVRKIHRFLHAFHGKWVDPESLRYTVRTANAVILFKAEKDIFDDQGKLNGICGIKTVRAIDDWLANPLHMLLL